MSTEHPISGVEPWRIVEKVIAKELSEIEEALKGVEHNSADVASLLLDQIAVRRELRSAIVMALAAMTIAPQFALLEDQLDSEFINILMCGLTGHHPNGSGAVDGGYWPPT